MQEIELKPCPFCGGKAIAKSAIKEIKFTIWCECSKCYAKTVSYCVNIEKEDSALTNIEKCKDKAIELWNMRV